MVMNDKKTGESINITSVSMSAASSAAMIGFSATIITLIAACISGYVWYGSGTFLCVTEVSKMGKEVLIRERLD
jgi:hypothetical protein